MAADGEIVHVLGVDLPASFPSLPPLTEHEPIADVEFESSPAQLVADALSLDDYFLNPYGFDDSLALLMPPVRDPPVADNTAANAVREANADASPVVSVAVTAIGSQAGTSLPEDMSGAIRRGNGARAPQAPSTSFLVRLSELESAEGAGPFSEPVERFRRLIGLSDQRRELNDPAADTLLEGIMRAQTKLDESRKRKSDALGCSGSCKCGKDFECNICYEAAKEPIVTPCGHLFCWSCLYKWLHEYSTNSECPVCNGEVLEVNVTPIYCNGDPGDQEDSNCSIPPRPKARRTDNPKRQRQHQQASSPRMMPVVEGMAGLPPEIQQDWMNRLHMQNNVARLVHSLAAPPVTGMRQTVRGVARSRTQRGPHAEATFTRRPSPILGARQPSEAGVIFRPFQLSRQPEAASTPAAASASTDHNPHAPVPAAETVSADRNSTSSAQGMMLGPLRRRIRIAPDLPSLSQPHGSEGNSASAEGTSASSFTSSAEPATVSSRRSRRRRN